MKVYYHSAIKNCEVFPGMPFRTVPCESYLQLVKEKNDSNHDILFNGTIIDTDIDRVSCNEEAELIIRGEGTRLVYSVRPLLRPLTLKYAQAYEQFAYEYSHKKFNELESIQTGELRMYAIDSSIEVKDWTALFDEIDSAFRSLKLICEQPKSHLKAVNEVRPIETVKRIGYESIPYLAAHSEDWLARTASGLKPARLFSRVEDDEYQIYENRVVKTLIDSIISFLRKTERQLRDQRDQLHGIINSSVQTGSFGFDVSFQKAVSELISTDSHADEHRTKSLELVNKLQKRSYILLKKYRLLRQTRLYRYLKKTKPVMNPLNETNILVMDKHYSKAFLLWKSIHAAIAPKVTEAENRVAFIETYRSYTTFVKTLCGFAAHMLDFDIDVDGRYFRQSDQMEILIHEENGLIRVRIEDKERISVSVPNEVHIPITASSFYKKFSYDGKQISWENDVTEDEIEEFSSLFKTRESRGKEQSEEKHKYATLKQFLFQQRAKKSRTLRSSFVIVPLVAELDSDSRTTIEKIAAELKSCKDDQVVLALPICDEGEQKVTRYSKTIDNTTLILPLTMFDINSFRRLQNLFLRHIVKFEKGVCPSCGGGMRTVGDQKVCDNCNQQILTKTQCPECRCEYHYISYSLSEDTILKMNEVDEKSFFQFDSLYQYKDIVDMSVTSGKLKTICPKCHHM